MSTIKKVSQASRKRREGAGPGITPQEPPYDDDIAAAFEAIMPPGAEPLTLFRVMARSPRILEKMRAGSLLDRGSISLRMREIIIDRTTARCGAEYEWGVHIAYFAERVALTPEEVRATVQGAADDPAWDAKEQLLIEMVDALCDTATIPPVLMGALREHWSDEQVLEMLALVGFYHGISFIANAAAVPLEDWAARFPE